MKGKRIIEIYTGIDMKEYKKTPWLQSQSRRGEMRKTKQSRKDNVLRYVEKFFKLK